DDAVKAFTAVAPIAMNGFDALLQSELTGRCRGFRNTSVIRPVRILVRAGPAASSPVALDLADALGRALSTLGEECTPPCDSRLASPSMAAGESNTINMLTWVGSADDPDAAADAAADAWFQTDANAGAITIVPEGRNPNNAAPARLRSLQVVWW